MKIAALAGGVGGAKLAHGLSQVLSSDELAIIVNTADDFEHFGLHISPDIDTVCYTLAEANNPETGWGRLNDTYFVLQEIERFSGPVWFKLGDKDLALHLERTRRLKDGYSLTQITLDLAQELGIKHKILPMSDMKVFTVVDTVNFGEIPFQEYFVDRKFEPKVKGFRFEGIEKATPTRQVLNTLAQADAVILCPSNPFVSINPILALNGIRSILNTKYVVAVSPIIGGKAVKGPLGKMFRELGYEVSPISVIQHYRDFLDCMFIDSIDLDVKKKASGIMIKVDEILLSDIRRKTALARNIVNTIKENTQ